MKQEVYVKNVELSDLNKAVIKSTWNNAEDRVEVEIYLRETLDVYIGSCDQETLRKKKEINIDIKTIKDALTSVEVQENVSYELNVRRLKFSLIAQETSDSDASFGEIIYLKIDVEKVEQANVLKMAIKLLDEMFETQKEMSKLKTDLNRSKEDLKETNQRYQQMNAQKQEYEKSVYQKFFEILNTKKQRIVDLERKLEKSKHDSSKFKNLSSDFDQSDLSLQEVKSTTPTTRRTPLKPAFINSSSDEAGPSTLAYVSPARSRNSSKNSTPRSRKPHQPSKSSRLTSRTLFDFKNIDDSDDSMEGLLKSPKASKRRKSVKTPEQKKDDTFTNFSIKVTQKVYEDELNQSSAELFIPKVSETASSSPENRNKSTTPDELAQVMECDLAKEAEGSLSDRGDSQSKTQSFLSDEIFTQQMEVTDDDEVIENSQPSIDSPSIFDSASKRKPTFFPSSSTRLASKKSNFSADTIDILG